MRALEHWKKLPKEAVDAPYQETFMARLDVALSNLIQLKTSLFIGVALDDIQRFLPTLTIIRFYETLEIPSSVVGLTTLREISGSSNTKKESYTVGIQFSGASNTRYYSRNLLIRFIQFK